MFGTVCSLSAQVRVPICTHFVRSYISRGCVRRPRSPRKRDETSTNWLRTHIGRCVRWCHVVRYSYEFLAFHLELPLMWEQYWEATYKRYPWHDDAEAPAMPQKRHRTYYLSYLIWLLQTRRWARRLEVYPLLMPVVQHVPALVEYILDMALFVVT